MKQNETFSQKKHSGKWYTGKVGNWLIKLICLLAAVGIWIYVDHADNPSDYIVKNLVVELRNEESCNMLNTNYVIVSGRDQKFSVEISGKKEDLEKYAGNVKLYADLRDADFSIRELTSYVRVRIEHDKEISVKLLDSTRREILVEIDEIGEMTLPVHSDTISLLLGDEKLDGNYRIGDCEARYGSEEIREITVKGPKNILNRIKDVSIEVDCTGIRKSFNASGDIVFFDRNGQKLDAEDMLYLETTPHNVFVNVPLLVEKQAEVQVVGSINGTKLHEYANVSVYPSVVTVLADTLIAEQNTHLIIPIELDESLIAYEDRFYKFDKMLETAWGVSILNDAEAEVSIEVNIAYDKVKDASYTIPYDAFLISGTESLSQGFTVLDDSLEIKLRGPVAVINELTGKNAQIKYGGDVVAILDLSSFDETASGIYNVPVQISVDVSEIEGSGLSEALKDLEVIPIVPSQYAPYYTVQVQFGKGTANDK